MTTSNRCFLHFMRQTARVKSPQRRIFRFSACTQHAGNSTESWPEFHWLGSFEPHAKRMNMTDKNKKSDEVARFLDNLMSFLADDDLRGKDLAEDLRARGLNPDHIADELRDLLREHAPTWSEKAERERLSALESFTGARETVHRPRMKTVELIKQVVEQMRRLGAPVTAGAYHQKFQEASDTDLESLLEDLRTQYELLNSQKNKDAQ